MINYDSILSAFDGKPTLLQWLKKVKNALDESVLKDVTIKQEGENIEFTFNFEDGTSITTPKITIHNGVDGVSITGIDTVRNEVVGDETLTTLRANYSNNTGGEFVVTAKNGKDGVSFNKMYLHCLRIYKNDGNDGIYFQVYSSKKTLTLEDALEYIPTVESEGVIGVSKNKILAFFENNAGSFGAVSVAKYLSGTGYSIQFAGACYYTGSNAVQKYNSSFKPDSIRDILLGENL